MKFFKKTLCNILALSIIFSFMAFPVKATSQIKVSIDGSQLKFDVQPQIINSRTMVPLRAIFEALGASVEWNENTKTVTSQKGNTSISLTINNPIMYVNGKSVSLDSPATIVDGRTLVPVRAISEAYGTTVSWDDNTKTVSISSKEENEKSATVNTTESTKEPEYKTHGPIAIRKNYGPMKLENYYSSGQYWWTNNVSAFYFTKCESTNIGKYKIDVNMQGITDHDSAWVVVYFYDSLGIVIGEVDFIHDVQPNVEYNVSDYTYVEKDIIDNATKIEFYSFSGRKAIKGNSEQSTQNSGNKVNINTSKSEISSFSELKDYIEEVGSDNTIFVSQTDKTFYIKYDSAEDMVTVFVDDKSTSVDTQVMLKIHKKDNPEVILRQKYRTGDYLFSGYYEDEELVKDISSYPVAIDYGLNIDMCLMDVESIFRGRGVQLDFEDFGIVNN